MSPAAFDWHMRPSPGPSWGYKTFHEPKSICDPRKPRQLVLLHMKSVWTSVSWWIQSRCGSVPSLLRFSGESYLTLDCYITSERGTDRERKLWNRITTKKKQTTKERRVWCQKSSACQTLPWTRWFAMGQKERYPLPFVFYKYKNTSSLWERHIDWHSVGNTFLGSLGFFFRPHQQTWGNNVRYHRPCIKNPHLKLKELLLAFLQINLEKKLHLLF